MWLTLALLPGALALVQQAHDAAHRGRMTSGLLHQRVESLLEARSESSVPFYRCREHPHMCRPPFNCHKAIRTAALARNQHANLRSWCAPSAENFVDNLVKECLVNHNLRASALAVFDSQVRIGSNELDASYCFLEGHCTNEGMNDSSTVEDGEKACDKRYGHAGWATDYTGPDGAALSLKEMQEARRNPFYVPMDHRTGFHEQKLTRSFAKAACAMGNFHCDVQYCKHTYCQIEYYRKRYKHLLPTVPGHEIRDRSAWTPSLRTSG